MLAVISIISGIVLQIIVKHFRDKRNLKDYIYDAENKCWIPKKSNLK